MKKWWENPWILDQLLMEKIIEVWNNMILTDDMRKWICILHVHHLLICYSWNKIGRLYLQIFLKIPSSGPKMCEEPLHFMWSCVFLFCNTHNYHGNLGFFVLKCHWSIIEIFRGMSVGTLKMRVPLFHLVSGEHTTFESEWKILKHYRDFIRWRNYRGNSNAILKRVHES